MLEVQNPFVKGDHVKLVVGNTKARNATGIRTGKVIKVTGNKCSVYWDQLSSRTQVSHTSLKFKIDEGK